MEAGSSVDFAGSERFLIKRQIGEGGMGIVYEALDRERGAPVALKMLRKVSADTIFRLKREFRGLHDIEHRNLVSLGELLQQDGQWFFTMELVEGVDFLSYIRPGSAPSVNHADLMAPGANALLGDTLEAPPLNGSPAAKRRFDEAKLRASARQLALGLSALHEVGRIHRDIKPRNILITPEGRVVILDFGLVSQSGVDSLAGDPLIVGTVAYMAPEQAASLPVGPEADWYAMGVLLYEALTERLPFEGTPYEVLTEKLKHEPSPPRSLVRDVPGDLDALCVDLLRFDPRTRPGDRDILERLGVRQRAQTSRAMHCQTPRAKTPPFVGRTDELADLWSAFRDTRHGDLVTVYVHGESGLGKSELVHRFVTEVSEQVAEAVALCGRCYERESVPYKAVDGLVDSLAQYLRELPDDEANAVLPRNAALLRRVFPILGRVRAIAGAPAPLHEINEPQELRQLVFTAARELLCLVAERHPLILVIDDMQWADWDSMLLLGDIVRQPHAPPLLLLLTSRTRPPAPPPLRFEDSVTWEPTAAERALRQFLHGDAAEVRWVELLPLETRAARQLAKILIARAELPSSVPPSIADEARGHPLLIDELVRYAATEGVQPQGRLRLEEAIWARASSLPAPARFVLSLAVMSDVPLTRRTLREAARMEASLFNKQVSLLGAANLIRSQGVREGDTLEPYHDRVRSAVLAHLDQRARTERHLRLASALETSDASRDRPVLLLRHLEGAGQRERAGHYAQEAAVRAMQAFAFDRAAELYRAALRLGAASDADSRRDLTIALAGALANAGRGAFAAEAYLNGAEGADPATRRECQAAAADQLLVTGHIERGLEVLDAVLSEAGVYVPSTPRRALLSVLYHRGILRLRGLRWREKHAREISDSDLARLDMYRTAGDSVAMVDLLRGQDFQVRRLLLALRLGERIRLARALGVEAVVLATSGPGSRARAEKTLRLAREAAQPDDAYLDAIIIWATGCVAYLVGQFERANELLETAETKLRAQPGYMTWELDNAQLFRVFVLRYVGDLSTMQTLAARCLRHARRRGDCYLETTLTRVSSLAQLATGDLENARATLDRVTWVAPAGSYHLQHWYELEARAELALAARQVAATRDDFEPEFDRLRHSLIPRIHIVRVASRYLEARLALACAAEGIDAGRALRRAARRARQLRREDAAYARAEGLLVAAAVGAQRGREDRAVELLRAAIEVAREADTALLGATARRRLGEILGGDEGAALIGDADAWMADAGIQDAEMMTEVIAPGFPTRSP